MSGPLLLIEHLEVRYGDLITFPTCRSSCPQAVWSLLRSMAAARPQCSMPSPASFRHAGSIRFDGEESADKVRFPSCAGSCAVAGAGGCSCSRVSSNLLLGATPLRDKARAATLLERVYEVFPKLAERRNQRAGTMSGGERQMLAVGRALMSDPKLLMLDEPSLGLAPAVVESMYDTFGRLHREGLTILLAEQSIELALEVSDFATVLQVGKSVLSGPAAALAEDPQVQKAYLGTG